MLKLLLITLLFSETSFGQAPNYEDLMMIYADGNYSGLIKHSKKYCKHKTTKNDPLPHFWLARAYYKTALQNHSADDEVFKKNIQLAIHEFSLSIQLDTNSTIQMRYTDYYDNMKNSIVEELLNNINSQSRSLFWINEYRKISPNSTGLTYLESYFHYITNNNSEAEQLQQKADSLLPSAAAFKNWSISEVLLLQQGVLLTVSYLNENEQKEKSKALIEKTRHCFKTDINGEIYLPESK